MVEQVTSLRQRGVAAAILRGHSHDSVDRSLLSNDSDLGTQRSTAYCSLRMKSFLSLRSGVTSW